MPAATAVKDEREVADGILKAMQHDGLFRMISNAVLTRRWLDSAVKKAISDYLGQRLGYSAASQQQVRKLLEKRHASAETDFRKLYSLIQTQVLPFVNAQAQRLEDDDSRRKKVTESMESSAAQKVRWSRQFDLGLGTPVVSRLALAFSGTSPGTQACVSKLASRVMRDERCRHVLHLSHEVGPAEPVFLKPNDRAESNMPRQEERCVFHAPHWYKALDKPRLFHALMNIVRKRFNSTIDLIWVDTLTLQERPASNYKPMLFAIRTLETMTRANGAIALVGFTDPAMVRDRLVRSAIEGRMRFYEVNDAGDVATDDAGEAFSVI